MKILIELLKSEHIVVSFFKSFQDPTFPKSPFRLFRINTTLIHFHLELECNTIVIFYKTRQLFLCLLFLLVVVVVVFCSRFFFFFVLLLEVMHVTVPL